MPQVSPDPNYLTKISIQQALEGNWQGAKKSNTKILEINPKDTKALNRLARAEMGLRNIQEAKTILKKILDIDNTDRIALNNLEKLKKIKNIKTHKSFNNTPPMISFIEEQGKTQILNLTKIASKSTLTQLQIGQEVLLKPSARKIKVTTLEKDYIGCLPDDLSQAIVYRLKLGSKYQAFIRSINTQGVQIFIKETKQSKRLKGTHTFPTDTKGKIYIAKPVINQPPLEMFDPTLKEED